MDLVSVLFEPSDCVAEGGGTRRCAECLNSRAVMLCGEEGAVSMLAGKNFKTQINMILADSKGVDNRLGCIKGPNSGP
jgi:hypothetical protein